MEADIQTLDTLEKKLGDVKQRLEEGSSPTSPSFTDVAPVFDQLPLYLQKVQNIRQRYNTCLIRRENVMSRLQKLRLRLSSSATMEGVVVRAPPSSSVSVLDAPSTIRYLVVYKGGVRIRSGPSFNDPTLSDVLGEAEKGRKCVLKLGDVVEGLERVMVNGQADVFVRLQTMYQNVKREDQEGKEGEEGQEGEEELTPILPEELGLNGFVPETKGSIVILRRLPPSSSHIQRQPSSTQEELV